MSRFFVLLFILQVTAVHGQNLLSLIPKSAYEVNIVDGVELETHFGLSELTKEDRYINFRERFDNGKDESWSGIMAVTTYEGGLNGLSMEKIIRFDYENDSVSGLGYLYLMKDEAQFSNFLKGLVEDAHEDAAVFENNLKVIQQTPYTIAWNQEVVLVLKVMVDYQFLRTKFKNDDYYMEELSEKERSELDVQKDELRDEIARKE